MIRPQSPTPFTDWCASKRHEADSLILDRLPADQFFATLDDGHDALDRLDAALGRKVPVRSAAA